MQIDIQTVDAFMAGDMSALKQIYEITKKSIYAVVFRMTGNQHDAEDILHEVYVRIHNKRSLYKKEKASLYTWLYRIAINFTLNALKQKKRWREDLIIEPLTADLLLSYVEKEESELALEVLERINPDFRVCLILCEIENKPYSDIAQLLNLSIGTVRSRINRGRKQLKELFEKLHGR